MKLRLRDVLYLSRDVLHVSQDGLRFTLITERGDVAQTLNVVWF